MGIGRYWQGTCSGPKLWDVLGTHVVRCVRDTRFSYTMSISGSDDVIPSQMSAACLDGQRKPWQDACKKRFSMKRLSRA